MSDQNASTANATPEAAIESKGKGKGAAEPETHDVSMDGDDSSSEEELDEVCCTKHSAV